MDSDSEIRLTCAAGAITSPSSRLSLVPVDEITPAQAETLAAEYHPSVEAFRKANAKWQTDNDILFAIIEHTPESRAVGMVSIGGINFDMPVVGYWIVSSRRGEGLMREAFGLMLSELKQREKLGVTGRIHMENIASINIFKRYGAKIETLPGTDYIRARITFPAKEIMD